MKRLWIVMMVGMLAGCAVTTVEYQYKLRFDRFYRLLNDTEKAAFRRDQFDVLGQSLEKRMAVDKQLSNAMDAVMFDEAIHTFRMDQVGMFFKRYILTGFHQDDYAMFIQTLPKEVLVRFVTKDPSCVPEIQKLLSSNKKLASWWKGVTTDGRLGDFSLEETVSLYRQYIFPEKTQSQVYALFQFLAGQKLLKVFLEGREDFSQRLADATKQIVVAREIRSLKQKTLLDHLSDEEFFRVYREVILKEMDRGALAKTLAMFPLE